jgi:hypothetical protein
MVRVEGPLEVVDGVQEGREVVVACKRNKGRTERLGLVSLGSENAQAMNPRW